jgi:ABC-2 type transport system ATP-binding protein/lipopolysaccharide transport system ATP-binding protein
MTTHISLNNISLEFPVYHANARSLKKQFLNLTAGGKLLKTSANSISVKALDDISLTIEHGDRIGVIGPNGAGKSTLLRVLSRIYEPSSGTIHIKGKVSPLLDLMFGIEPELTGYENIFTRGILLGLTHGEIRQKISSIADFTGLGDYLAMPVRTYSAGMQLRLAFGVATSIYPEILILDEVVGVGDLDFMDKAKARLSELIAQSGIVVLATHSSDMIREICNKVILLKNSKLLFFGGVDEGLKLAEIHRH